MSARRTRLDSYLSVKADLQLEDEGSLAPKHYILNKWNHSSVKSNSTQPFLHI